VSSGEKPKFDHHSPGGSGSGGINPVTDSGGRDDKSRDVPEAQRSAGRAGAGDVTAELFERAVQQHSRRLLAIARAIVGTRAAPEDVVQQAVMNLYQHRHRYDWREPGGLLKRAVVNEALRLLRHPRMSMVADDHPSEPRSSGAVGGMIEDETVAQVRAAIARLPDHFRAALVLCEYEELSYVEIAQALGASVPQVKTWLHRARRQLAGMLEGYVNENREARRPK